MKSRHFIYFFLNKNHYFSTFSKERKKSVTNVKQIIFSKQIETKMRNSFNCIFFNNRISVHRFNSPKILFQFLKVILFEFTVV